MNQFSFNDTLTLLNIYQNFKINLFNDFFISNIFWYGYFNYLSNYFRLSCLQATTYELRLINDSDVSAAEQYIFARSTENRILFKLRIGRSLSAVINLNNQIYFIKTTCLYLLSCWLKEISKTSTPVSASSKLSRK